MKKFIASLLLLLLFIFAFLLHTPSFFWKYLDFYKLALSSKRTKAFMSLLLTKLFQHVLFDNKTSYKELKNSSPWYIYQLISHQVLEPLVSYF